MSKIISIANHKGGVGKTTSVVNISAGLALRGYKVLAVDLDTQANLTGSLMSEEPERTIYNSLVKAEALPIITIKEGLDILPSSLDMATAEIELSGRMDREYLLQELLEPLRAKYDYIIIDCPPSLGLLTLNALVASDELYITLTAEGLPARGLKTLTDSIERVQRRANKGLRLSGIILTRWQGRNLNKALENSLKASYEEIIFKTKIRENIALAEAPLCFESIFEYNSSSNGAKDYKALVEEIVKRG